MIGEHPLVRRLMKGIYNCRPPAPRYTFIWDTTVLINYLRQLDTATLSFKLLSMKTLTLLTLLTGQRVSTMCQLRLSDMFLSESCILFSISGLLKHSRPGRVLPPIQLVKYAPDSALCPVATLTTYLQLRRTLVAADVTPVFITYGKPHHPASKDSLARWIKDTLQCAGIDVDTFKPHSCRAASTSKASSVGVSIEDILRSGQWAKDSVFYKHYCKYIINNELNDSFQAGILPSVS